LTSSEQSLPAGTWAADKVHSHVRFSVEYLAGTFVGSFAEVDASVSGGVLKGTTCIGNVQVPDAHLEAHLQAPDFFDPERHPALTFESAAIAVDADRITIDGTITIKGHTESVAITGSFAEPVLDPSGGTRFGLELETKIDRTRFGLSWNTAMPDGVPALSDEVTIVANLQFVKRS